MTELSGERGATDGWHWQEVDVVNCSMRERQVEQGKLIIPEDVLEVLQWRVFMQEVHDGNGPGHVECPLCGARTLMRWKNGARLDKQSDIEHTLNCPWAWAQGVLEKRSSCQEVKWREGSYRFKLWAHPSGISWKVNLLAPSGHGKTKTFRRESAAETWIYQQIAAIRSIEHESGAIDKAIPFRSKIFIGRMVSYE
jgi:hypothetical protein